MITAIKKGDGDEQMYLHCRPSALEQYGVHLLIQHDQGFTRSHWMPPSGNYSLRIALAAARVTINKTTMQNVPTLLALLMAIAMRRCPERLARI